MTCEDLQELLSAYVDDELPSQLRQTCDGHLGSCPVCRAELVSTRLLTRGLAALPRPAPPAALASSISHRLQTERAVLAQPGLSRRESMPLSQARVFCWLAPRAMPFGVGAFASTVLFVMVLAGLLPAMRTMHVLERSSLLSFSASADEGGYDVTEPITPEDYAASRTPFTAFSPSLNPRGALALTAPMPFTETSADEDDMIVVAADVFSNGEASLVEVVTPPRDARMLADLDAALRRTPPFVPARLDHRPQTMRVVFMVQRKNVRDHDY